MRKAQRRCPCNIHCPRDDICCGSTLQRRAPKHPTTCFLSEPHRDTERRPRPRRFARNPAKVSSPELALDMLCVTLNDFFLGFIQHLPALAYVEDNSQTTVALYDMIDVSQAISDLIAPFTNAGQDALNLFVAFRDQLQKNQLEASKNNPKKLVTPDDSDGTPREKVHAFLKIYSA